MRTFRQKPWIRASSAAKIPATIPNYLTSLSNQRSDGQAMCQARFGKKHRCLLSPVSNADRC